MVKETNYIQLPEVRQGWLNTVKDHLEDLTEQELTKKCLQAGVKFQNTWIFFWGYTRSTTKKMIHGPGMHSIIKNCATISVDVQFLLKIGHKNIMLTGDPKEIELYLYERILDNHTPTEAHAKFSVNKYRPYAPSKSTKRLEKILNRLYGVLYISLNNKPFRWYLGGEPETNFLQEYKQLNNKECQI